MQQDAHGPQSLHRVQANELELALDVYQQLVREGCTPNLVTFNILIDIYGKTNQWQEAVKVLDALDAQVCAARLPCMLEMLRCLSTHLLPAGRVLPSDQGAAHGPMPVSCGSLLSAV